MTILSNITHESRKGSLLTPTVIKSTHINQNTTYTKLKRIEFTKPKRTPNKDSAKRSLSAFEAQQRNKV